MKDVGRITIVTHRIDTKDRQPPIFERCRWTSLAKQDRIEAQVRDLLETELIRHLSSTWAAPVTLAPKSDGSDRFCCDLRKLNDVTVPCRHPLPLIRDLLDRVATSLVFTTVDAVCGYWHVALDEESIPKTSFVTSSGQYEWLVMHFGLKNTPARFERIMQHLLRGFIGKGVEVYIDDVIVHSRDVDEHVALLSKYSPHWTMPVYD